MRPLALLRPDARLLGHAGPGLASLRISRPDGSAVAYRLLPGRPRPASIAARRLSGGETARGAIAEFDLGGARAQRGLELQLQLRSGALTGRVRVLGSSDRRTWARFARGVVYRIAGASSVPASSTRIVYAPVDYRYLRVEIAGATSIDGAARRSRRRRRCGRRPRRAAADPRPHRLGRRRDARHARSARATRR